MQHGTITVLAGTIPVMITASDAHLVTLQNKGERSFMVGGSVDTTPPAPENMIEWLPKQAVAGELMSTIFPGLPGVCRLFVLCEENDAIVFRSYA